MSSDITDSAGEKHISRRTRTHEQRTCGERREREEKEREEREREEKERDKREREEKEREEKEREEKEREGRKRERREREKCQTNRKPAVSAYLVGRVSSGEFPAQRDDPARLFDDLLVPAVVQTQTR